MGYRDHIVAKLGALAVAGGTTAMLFAASPVHTTFSATTSGSVSASGANVSQTLTGGYLTASNLLPGDYTNPALVSVHNTGSVAEDFTLKIDPGKVGNIGNGLGELPHVHDLQQLTYSYTLYRCSSPFTGSASDLTGSVGGCGEATAGNGVQLFPRVAKTSESPVTISIPWSVPVGHYVYAAISFGLVANPTATEGGQNAWNGASVTIPYTITAEPAASTSTSPTLKTTVKGQQTPAPVVTPPAPVGTPPAPQ
jgi:hypothetical protein